MIACAFVIIVFIYLIIIIQGSVLINFYFTKCFNYTLFIIYEFKWELNLKKKEINYVKCNLDLIKDNKNRIDI